MKVVKMLKVLLIGAHLHGNLGGPSLLISTSKVLRTFFPDLRLKMLSPCIRHDSKQTGRYGVEIIYYRMRHLFKAFLLSLIWAALDKLGLNTPFILNNNILKEYQSSDIILDITGISFTDFFPNRLGYVVQAIRLLVGILLNKPVVKFTQDMGPFNNKMNKYLARLCLNRLRLIITRSEVTKRYLEELGVNKPIYVHPDTAFVLDPSPDEHMKRIMQQERLDGKPLIALVPSREVDQRISTKEKKDIRYQNRYTTVLKKLAEDFIKRLDALIVFIPNEISDQKGAYDDIYVANKIYRNIAQKKKMRLITKKYEAPELKGIIAKCDLVITSRYHSTVAALSTCIPCLVIGWGFKYDQLMEITDQSEFVCDFESLDFPEVKEKANKLWHDRDRIKCQLESLMPIIQQSVLSGGKLIKNLIDGRET